jgi:hypothetical protein
MRSTQLVRATQTAATGERILIIHESGTTTARAKGTGEAAAIDLGIISAKMKRVSVENTTAIRIP